MKIIVVRHGQTEWNALNKVAGQKDIPLNKNGEEQANKIREDLKDMPIDLIITSPLIRARKTAEIINQGRKIDIIVDKRAIERSLGIFEGKSNLDKEFNEVHSYNKNIDVENGESCRTCVKRVFNFLDDIIKKYRGKYENVLICTHGFIAKYAMWYFNGIPKEEKFIKVKNCQIDMYDV